MFPLWKKARNSSCGYSLVLLLTALATAGCGAQTDSLTANDPSACVSDAATYMESFGQCEPVPNVCSNLYGVIAVQDSESEPTRIYPDGFRWAWVSGFENLESYAQWQSQSTACGTDGGVTTKILRYVGFDDSSIGPDKHYYLTAIDLGGAPSLTVPSFGQWFLLFSRTYRLVIPLEVQKEVTLAPGVDPPARFTDLTGCVVEGCGTTDDLEGCLETYGSIAARLDPVNPYLGEGSTDRCVAAFQGYQKGLGRPPLPDEVRALLSYCVDANPCNSGLGIGFNPAQEALYTGREFVVDNVPLESPESAIYLLPSPGLPSAAR